MNGQRRQAHAKHKGARARTRRRARAHGGRRFGGTHRSPDFKCGFRLAALDRERDVHDVSARQKVATHLLDHQEQHAAALQQQLTSTRSELADDKQTIVTLKEQLTAITRTLFDNVALQQLQEQLTSTRSELADDT